MFWRWHLKNIRQVDTILRGNCNSGVTTTSTKGHLGVFDMWLNQNGIANLLSIPPFEADGFRMTCDTDTECIIYNPQGHKIVFKRDTVMCNRMPYINVCECMGDLALVNIKESQMKGLANVRRD